MKRARVLLDNHDSAAPAHLDRGHPPAARPALPVIRRRDFVQLFDTTPDLTGIDIDVSRYIRASDERDVQVAWREWDKQDGPPTRGLHRDELCRVDIGDLQALLKKAKQPAYRWDLLSRKWVTCRGDPAPGMTILLPCAAGGYTPRWGWTGAQKDVPTPINASATSQDADEADLPTYVGAYVPLAEHLLDTRAQMVEMLDSLRLDALPSPELIEAAHWHDVGKAHEVFQEMLTCKLPEGSTVRDAGPYAKSVRATSGRSSRPHFRHELASALAVLQQDDTKDLVAYLVAAHHGKVRMSIRARPTEEPAPGLPPETPIALGVLEGDTLPEVDLGASQVSRPQEIRLGRYLSLGGGDGVRSWRERTEALLERLGPFRLAYLEALVRVADWRASAPPEQAEGATP